MGLFGSLFDFNRDGKMDLGESMFEMGLIGAVLNEDARQQRAQRAAEAAQKSMEDLDAAIQEQIDDLEHAKLDMELEEPDDICSEAWDDWDGQMSVIQDEIDELEAALED